jgi:RES domain-containing protein
VGARLYGRRWNSRGVSVVYASSSLALAAVEIFVNLEPNLRPADLVSIEGIIPGAIEVRRLDPTALPAGMSRETNRCGNSEMHGFALERRRDCSCCRRQSVANGMCC